MGKRDYKKEFCALMDRFAFRYPRWQIWNDFLSLSAISLANAMPVPEKEEREKQYLSIINSYPKEAQEVFPEMLGLVVLALGKTRSRISWEACTTTLGCTRSGKGSSLRPTISAISCPSCSLPGMKKRNC